MRTLTLNEDNYLIPANMNEFTTSQLLYLAQLVNKEITPSELKLKMLLFCMGARVCNYKGSFYRIKVSRKKKYYLNAEELAVIADMFDFLFIETENKIDLNITLTRNPFPMIRCGWVKLYGAADGLTNLDYGRFQTLTYQAQFLDSPKDFNSFLSSLYRKKNGKESRMIRFISERQRRLILWYFTGCMNFLGEKFPASFSGDSDDNVDVFDSQQRIIDLLAKNDLTKKEKIRNSFLYDALYTMEIGIEQAEERERLYQQ